MRKQILNCRTFIHVNWLPENRTNNSSLPLKVCPGFSSLPESGFLSLYAGPQTPGSCPTNNGRLPHGKLTHCYFLRQALPKLAAVADYSPAFFHSSSPRLFTSGDIWITSGQG